MGAAFIALLLLVAAHLLQHPERKIQVQVKNLTLCVNQTVTIDFNINMKGYYMYVTAIGGGDGLSLSYPPPGPAESFRLGVTALNPGKYEVLVKIVLIGEGKAITKTYSFWVKVVKCATSS